jgi:hypothetical protein
VRWDLLLWWSIGAKRVFELLSNGLELMLQALYFVGLFSNHVVHLAKCFFKKCVPDLQIVQPL